MKRREFLKSGAALAAQLVSGKTGAQNVEQNIRKVYVVAKCHLDLGFTDFERGVIRTYFESYIPTAIETAQKLQQTNAEERYVWTLGSWMVYAYLEQASPEHRKTMEQAIHNGHIAWHAMPFTWQSEMLDPSLMKVSFRHARRRSRQPLQQPLEYRLCAVVRRGYAFPFYNPVSRKER